MSTNGSSSVNPSPYGLRKPCSCGGRLGHIETRNGQACVFCQCGRYQYNAPKIETGEHQRSVSTRTGITPSVRNRVFRTHGHRCIACGASPDDGTTILHCDHLISKSQALKAGVYDELIESEHNLAPMCEECNLGKRAETVESIQLIYRVLLIKERLAVRRLPDETAS